MAPSTTDTSRAPRDDSIAQIIAAHAGREGPLLPILHALQEAFGHIPEAAHAPICAALKLTKAELHGVISFYHDFRAAPAGRHILKICRAEACQSMGSEALAAGLLAKLGLGWGETSGDGRLTVEPVYCLGLCSAAPAAILDDRVAGRLDAARLDALVAEART